MIKKIIITGGWGYGNIGDEAILKYTYLDLKKIFFNCPITILSYNPQQTEYHHGLTAKESLHKIFKDAKGLDIKATSLKIISEKNTPVFLKHYVEQFDNETLFILAGGGYFNDHWKESFYSHLCEISIAKNRDTKISIIGQTIGPIGERKNRDLFNQGVNFVDYINVRDKTSYELLKKILPQKEIHLSCDAVIRNGNHYVRNAASKQISIMFQRKRPYTNASSTLFGYRLRQGIQLLLGESKRFEHNICVLIKKLKVEYPDYRIVFVQSTNWNKEKIKMIMNKSGADGVIVDSHVNGYLAEIAKSSLVISTNMHPAIIATSIGIPTIALSHTYKIDDYMTSISMEKYTFHDLRTKTIVGAISELLKKQEISEILIRSNEKLNIILNDNYNTLQLLFNRFTE